MIRRLGAAVLCAASAQAHAHGFGQRYDLPLPLALYIAAAALTVLISCVMLVLFVPAARHDRPYPTFDLLAFAPTRLLASPAVIALVRLAMVTLYLLLLAAGFLGAQNPFRNIVPIAIWAIWWVGLGYFSALVGDLWAISNPLETIFAAAERAYARATRGRRLSLQLGLPSWVGVWPAVALYLAFLWMEMVWEGSDSPYRIARAIGAYSLLTWAGMWLFGRQTWLARGEAFTRVFGLLARFSPMDVELKDRRVAKWQLRPYAVGLLDRNPASASEIMLVVTILAAVSFDGFLETPMWASIVEALSEGGGAAPVLRTAGLMTAPLLFLVVYLFFCRLIALSAQSGGRPSDGPRTTLQIARLFAPTLVPIAIAYQVAHYLSFLTMAGQYMIPIASDPLGLGWNLFGTVNHLVRVAILDARLVWIVSLAAIVAGHVAALYLGHLASLGEFPDRATARRSQWPMLVLMVAYTMLSLWMIAQPIVTSR